MAHRLVTLPFTPHERTRGRKRSGEDLHSTAAGDTVNQHAPGSVLRRLQRGRAAQSMRNSTTLRGGSTCCTPLARLMDTSGEVRVVGVAPDNVVAANRDGLNAAPPVKERERVRASVSVLTAINCTTVPLALSPATAMPSNGPPCGSVAGASTTTGVPSGGTSQATSGGGSGVASSGMDSSSGGSSSSGGPAVILSGLSRPTSVVAFLDTMFWSDDLDETIYACSIVDCLATLTPFVTGVSKPDGLAMWGTHLYWTSRTAANGPTDIQRCDVQYCGGTSETVVSYSVGLGRLSVVGNTLLVPNSSTGEVERCDLDGSSAGVLPLCTDAPPYATVGSAPTASLHSAEELPLAAGFVMAGFDGTWTCPGVLDCSPTTSLDPGTVIGITRVRVMGGTLMRTNALLGTVERCVYSSGACGPWSTVVTLPIQEPHNLQDIVLNQNNAWIMVQMGNTVGDGSILAMLAF